MEVNSVTLIRRKCETLADDKARIYAWGALSVTLSVAGTDTKKELHVTLSKEELVEALKRITDREAEIASMTSVCHTCKKIMKPEWNCGGDCLQCMAEVAGDPECIEKWNNIKRLSVINR